MCPLDKEHGLLCLLGSLHRRLPLPAGLQHPPLLTLPGLPLLHLGRQLLREGLPALCPLGR